MRVLKSVYTAQAEVFLLAWLLENPECDVGFRVVLAPGMAVFPQLPMAPQGN